MRRRESYEVLSDVLFKGRHAHLVLKERNLDIQDQAFVSALVYTVLQNRLYLEYQYADLIDGKLPKEIELVILLGCAQHFKMDRIPDYACVNEAVELSKEIGKKRYAGVVNAVLKKVIKRGERLPSDELERTSVVNSMPIWIVKLLTKQYSESFALDYSSYCQKIKPNYVRINTLKENPELFDYLDLTGSTPIALPTLFQTTMLSDGYCVIQDINSQRVVSYMNLEENLSVLDCCCGPGTKTSQIAAEMKNTGEIEGVELYRSRSDETVSLLDRCGVNNATIVTSDLLEFDATKEYDRILLDAPCSGLGVLSHKHDLRYNIKPEDLDQLVTLQAQMLDHVAPFVKCEGILVYATCTLNRKENERQIQSFLERHQNYVLVKDETTNPMETRGDGFYIAQLKRTC